MKSGINELDFLHVDTWDISKGFTNCTNLTTSISDWDVSNVTNMSDIFEGCTSLDEDYILKERKKKLDKIMEQIMVHKTKKLKKIEIVEDYFIPNRTDKMRERKFKLEKIMKRL